jgi:hypothetical protein
MVVITALGLIVGLSGCEKQAAQPAAAPAAATATLAVDKKMVEAGCGSCMFHMDGVSGCQLAVKIDGKPYLVTGTDVNAHKAGLCEATKQAEVSGQVKDDKFVATVFALKQ